MSFRSMSCKNIEARNTHMKAIWFLISELRRNMRSSLVRIGRMGSTLLLSALGRSRPWRETLGIMREREAEGIPLQEESFRKMCLENVWTLLNSNGSGSLAGWHFSGFITVFLHWIYWKIHLSGTSPVVVVFKCSQCKHMTFGVGRCWCLERRLLGLTRSRAWQMASWCLGMQKTACPALHDWHLQHNMLHTRIKGIMNSSGVMYV